MPDLNYEIRNYREQFNAERFRGFTAVFRETDLWIGVDRNSLRSKTEKRGKPGSRIDSPDLITRQSNTEYLKSSKGLTEKSDLFSQSGDSIIENMKELTLQKIKELRRKLDDYILTEPQFVNSLIPFYPGKDAPAEAVEMAEAASVAGIGPMSSVAGLFAREAGLNILKNFSPEEVIIENGGDIFAVVKDKLILSVFAGKSPLSDKTGLVIPPGTGQIGICTSAGTVGPSLSFGRADAVVVVCKNILLADAFATALGNEVKSADDIERVLNISEKYPEIISVVIICNDKIGIRGIYDIKILKHTK